MEQPSHTPINLDGTHPGYNFSCGPESIRLCPTLIITLSITFGAQVPVFFAAAYCLRRLTIHVHPLTLTIRIFSASVSPHVRLT